VQHRRAIAARSKARRSVLARDGEHAVTVDAEVVGKGLEGAGKAGRVEQPAHPAEDVVARQALLQAQEFPQKRLAVLGEVREIDATLRAADRGHQRARQDVEQRVPLGVPPPRGGELPKLLDQRCHRLLRSGTNGRIQIKPKEEPYCSDAIPLGGREISGWG
jgi:hypothetical protein